MYQPAGSGTVASVMVVLALRLAETLPAASLAHAYSVFAPAVVNVYELGAEADQPAADADGAMLDSFASKPVTPTLSDAVKLVIGTVSEADVAGMVNPVTVGATLSASVTVTLALRFAETLPAASLAHA